MHEQKNHNGNKNERWRIYIKKMFFHFIPRCPFDSYILVVVYAWLIGKWIDCAGTFLISMHTHVRFFDVGVGAIHCKCVFDELLQIENDPLLPCNQHRRPACMMFHHLYLFALAVTMAFLALHCCFAGFLVNLLSFLQLQYFDAMQVFFYPRSSLHPISQHHCANEWLSLACRHDHRRSCWKFGWSTSPSSSIQIG